MPIQEPNTNAKKKGIGLGIFSLIVSIIAFICGSFPVIYDLFPVIYDLFPSILSILLIIHTPGVIIVLISGTIALIKNRMLGKILAIIALIIIFGSIILDYFVLLGLFL